MLYTGNGDNGTTQFFGCDQRFSKSSVIAEALGSLDELNSFLGWCKVKMESNKDVLENIQQDLFVIQAETAGADKHIEDGRILWLESVITEMGKNLPPIKNFIVPGGSEVSSMLDMARTVSRRAERRMVSVREEAMVPINDATLKYLNRLSSLLYALARLANVQAGVGEENPHY